MATMADSRVRLRVGQNDTEELTAPGQAILVRGTETVKVMTPYLPDDERAQRLARLWEGEQDMTYALLAFAPHFYMRDLLCTSVRHAQEAEAAARATGLVNVRVGNRHQLERGES